MKQTKQSNLPMRIFYKTSNNILSEFFGKHKDDIETIHSGINAIEPNVSKIIIFDAIQDDGTYHNQMEFGILSPNTAELHQEVRVNISGRKLDWLVKSSNTNLNAK